SEIVRMTANRAQPVSVAITETNLAEVAQPPDGFGYYVPPYQTIDVNGDGLTDFFTINAGTGTGFLEVSRGDGAFVETSLTWADVGWDKVFNNEKALRSGAV